MRICLIFLIFFSTQAFAINCDIGGFLRRLVGASEDQFRATTRLINSLGADQAQRQMLGNIVANNNSDLAMRFLQKLESLDDTETAEIVRALTRDGNTLKLDDFYAPVVGRQDQLRGVMLDAMREHLREVDPTFESIMSTLSRRARRADMVDGAQVNSFSEIPLGQSDTFRPPRLRGEEGHPRLIERFESQDQSFQNAYLAAYNSLNDNEQIAMYLEDLYTEAYSWQLRRQAAGVRVYTEAATENRLDPQAIAAVLVRRLKDRGDDNFTTLTGSRVSSGRISQGDEVRSSNQEFQFAVRTGPFFDNQFNDLLTPNRHSSITHMIQRDYIDVDLFEHMGQNSNEFYEYLGSPRGIAFWADLFDSGSTSTFASPEHVSRVVGGIARNGN